MADYVIFNYDPTTPVLLELPLVTVYKSGLIHVEHPSQELTTHITNCEVVWTDNIPPDGGDGHDGEPAPDPELTNEQGAVNIAKYRKGA